MDSMHHKPRTIEPARLSAASSIMWALEQSPSERLFLCQAALATQFGTKRPKRPNPMLQRPSPAAKANTDGNFTATTVVDHNYDLGSRLPSCWSRMRRLYTTSPTNPGGFDYGLNDTIHLFKVETDTKSLIKTENPKEASVSITLTMIDNHVRATVVFTGGYADDQIPYRLNLASSTLLGTITVDRDYDSGRDYARNAHDYYHPLRLRTATCIDCNRRDRSRAQP